MTESKEAVRALVCGGRAVARYMLLCALAGLPAACVREDERDFYNSEVCRQRTWGVCGEKNRERGILSIKSATRLAAFGLCVAARPGVRRERDLGAPMPADLAHACCRNPLIAYEDVVGAESADQHVQIERAGMPSIRRGAVRVEPDTVRLEVAKRLYRASVRLFFHDTSYSAGGAFAASTQAFRLTRRSD